MAVLPFADVRIIENEELLELLPHRGKMLLISRVTEYDINASRLRSEYDVSKACLFYDPGIDGVPAYMCFEFMAQAVAALSGLTIKIMGGTIQMGLILSVSSLEIKIPVFKPGDVIQIEVNEQQAVDVFSTFHCAARIGENEAVSARLMVMGIENPMELIEKANYGK